MSTSTVTKKCGAVTTLCVSRWAMICRILLIGFGFSASARSTSATLIRPESPVPWTARISSFSFAASCLAAGEMRSWL